MTVTNDPRHAGWFTIVWLAPEVRLQENVHGLLVCDVVFRPAEVRRLRS